MGIIENQNDSTNIKLVPLKTFLPHIDTKAKWTEYLGKALLANFVDLEKNLVVVYGTSTYANSPGLFRPNIRNHQHEEADTLIPMHVMDASKTDRDIRDIDVYSPDTDIFVLLIDLVTNNNIEGKLYFITGKGKSRRRINIYVQCPMLLGFRKAEG